MVPPSDSNHGPSPGYPDLGMLKKITTSCTVAAFFISLFSHQNALRRALNELKLFNRNRLTTPHLLCCTHRLGGFTSPVKNVWRSMENKHKNPPGNFCPKMPIMNCIDSYLAAKIQISFNHQKTSYVRIICSP